jgi:hypothetical protein
MRSSNHLRVLALIAGAPTCASAMGTNGYFADAYGIKAEGEAGAGIAFPQDSLTIAERGGRRLRGGSGSIASVAGGWQSAAALRHLLRAAQDRAPDRNRASYGVHSPRISQ